LYAMNIVISNHGLSFLWQKVIGSHRPPEFRIFKEHDVFQHPKRGLNPAASTSVVTTDPAHMQLALAGAMTITCSSE
jgi:hypothetical protein